MKNFIHTYKIPLILFSIAAGIRIIGFFFAQNTEADATSRVLLAEELRDNFRLIYSGHWPSLQFYFLAFFSWLCNDRVLGPELLCMILGAISVLPFYGFCKNLFTQKGAVFSSLVFTFCPVILRNSFIPLSEIFYLCFTCFALYYLSKAWTSDLQKTKNALIAGLFLTIAGGMRIEAWMLIPILCIPFLLNKDLKSAFFFCVTASLFPLFWMIGNYIDHGDILYSIHSVERWNFVAEGHNENIDRTEVFKRILFFPFSYLIMLTPLGIIILLYYATKKGIKLGFTRNQFGLLIIFLLLCVIYLVQCVDGKLFMQHRFTITLVLFSIPFFGFMFESTYKLIIKYAFSLILIAGLIPFSFYWHIIDFSEFFFFNERAKNSLNMIIAESYRQTGAIPMLENREISSLVDQANNELIEEDGLVIDYDGWENTYYIAQSVAADYNNIYIQEGAKNSTVDFNRLQQFFKSHPDGLIILKDFSMIENSVTITGNLLLLNDNSGLELSKIDTLRHLRLFHYEFIEGERFIQSRMINNGKSSLYIKKKDIEFFREIIRRDKIWLGSVIQKAREKKVSIEEMIEMDAEYMFNLENSNL